MDHATDSAKDRIADPSAASAMNRVAGHAAAPEKDRIAGQAADSAKDCIADTTAAPAMNLVAGHTADHAGEGFAVLSGDDGFALPLIALGGDGLVSVISNAAPAKTVAMVRAALAGDFEAARRYHYELLPLMKAAFIETNPVPIKAALNMMGLPAGPTRLPLGPLSPAGEAPLRAALSGLGLL